MSHSEVTDPRYEVEERVYIIPPSDSIPTLTGTIDRQPTPEEPYYTVISDEPDEKAWSMVASRIVSCEVVAPRR